MKKRICILALGLLALLAPALTLAAITLTVPPSGPNTISGTGAAPNGPVELFVNDLSQGSIVANGSGAFTFTGLSLTPGDKVRAAASQVWNFNTAGNLEGWAAVNNNGQALATTVAGGKLTVTADANGGATIHLTGTQAAIAPAVTRVFELRYRITSGNAINAGSPNTTIMTMAGPNGAAGGGDDVFSFGQGWNPKNGPDFVTSQVDLSVTNNGTTATPWTNGQKNIQVGFGLSGLSAGDTIEVDYVRLAEGFEWEFNNDGDAMLWEPNQFIGNIKTLSVAGGLLTLTANNAAPGLSLPFNWVNTGVFRVWSSRMAVNGGAQGQFEQLQWIDNGGADQYGANGNRANRLYTDDGQFQESTIDLKTMSNADNTGTPSWGPDPTSLALIVQPFLNAGGSQTAQIDYLRLMPLNAYGPSSVYTLATVPVELSGFSVD